MRIKKLIIVVSALILILDGCSKSNSPCPTIRNPDELCGVEDKRPDGTHLVWQFNIDSEKHRLFLWKSGQGRFEIQHPYYKIKSYSENLNSGKRENNSIKFDLEDVNFLIVNNEKFPITKITDGS